jgi:carbon monoxide dehydrogenase subunit G
MAHYQVSIRSSWSVAEAFEYMADLEHFADWDPGVKGVVRAPGPREGAGAAFDVTVAAIGRDLLLRYETMEIDVPRRVKVQADTGTLRSVDVITVHEEPGGGSVVTYDADLSLKGVLRFGDPLLGLAFRRVGDRAAAGLRSVLEGAVP